MSACFDRGGVWQSQSLLHQGKRSNVAERQPNRHSASRLNPFFIRASALTCEGDRYGDAELIQSQSLLHQGKRSNGGGGRADRGERQSQSLLHQGKRSNSSAVPKLRSERPESQSLLHQGKRSNTETGGAKLALSGLNPFFIRASALTTFRMATARWRRSQSLLHQGKRSNDGRAIRPGLALLSLNPFFIRASALTMAALFVLALPY